jgi:hypothetical protein
MIGLFSALIAAFAEENCATPSPHGFPSWGDVVCNLVNATF